MGHTEETKRKISEANKGRIPSLEARKKMSVAGKGRKKTEEHKAKIGAAHKGMKKPYAAKNLKHGTGENNAFYGRNHTEETKEKIRACTVKQLSKREPMKISKPEKKMLSILDDLNIEYIRSKGLFNKTIPDAMDVKNKIVFYADGDYWHNLPEYIKRDKSINRFLGLHGWTVLRFWEHEILDNSDSVIDKIKKAYAKPIKRLIYIAGPYRSDTEYGVKLNIDRAEAVSLKYWKAGYAAFCPNKNSAFMAGACPDEVWLEGGLAILAKCDALIVMTGWQESEGTIMEMEFAREHRIPIFFDEVGEKHFTLEVKK